MLIQMVSFNPLTAVMYMFNFIIVLQCEIKVIEIISLTVPVRKALL